MTTPHERFVRALVGAPETTDQVAVARLPGSLILAAWQGADARVTVAVYTTTSRCRHLWTGPHDAVEACRDALAAEGLPIPRPAQPKPTEPTALADERADVLDLFG